ncbi:hypothetical protein KC332_g1392 [Hortaea werneckii]|nr:hypothetical protein KC358_g1440 [Hortaea werneckii]KAI6852569.1 hypothetical protein KC350_g779 [Hortaea werneckii]KAI6944823.1 hypothetical protein KC341_g534 [Hortaea werneckii]KAI6951148.1 hypothetical protein KC348_g250 [Hortaea werneckii]KAI6983088.1 hypothetical protein KC321_g263 [Hortaea werneckii]
MESLHTEKRPAGRSRPMRVLNLGLFRTGTSSLREALSILEFQKVYHMSYVFQQKPSDSKIWLRAFDAKYRKQGAPFSREEWDGILGDCDAVSDFPCAAFSEELIAAYPEARVVLSVRDSPEVWYRSVLQTVWYVHMQSPFAPDKLLGQPGFERFLPSLFRMGKRMFSDVFEADFPRTGIDVYNEHIERIRTLVPPDNLLVFNVKDGWTPLCDFLGVPVPVAKEPCDFPIVNEGQAVVAKVLGKQAMLRRHMRILFWTIVASVAALMILFVLGKDRWRDRLIV